MDSQLLESVDDIHALVAASRQAPSPVVLVDMASGPDLVGRLLRTLHQRLPRSPIGLITRDESRAEAMALLRARQVDRVIPEAHYVAEFGGHCVALEDHGARLHGLHQRLKDFPGRTFFVTGATGFLGGHFLRYLLRCGKARIVALTRDSGKTPFDRRLAHLQQLHPGCISCIQGDVGLPGLGLRRRDIEKLAASVDEVWHLAAVTKFDELFREEIQRVNLTGTRHVVAFARNLPGMKRFHHVSTAYVAGNWPEEETVPEGPLTSPPGFKNPYEESKFYAECVVATSGLPATIYRPSIILGERVSGLCDGQTVYNVAKMLRLAQMAGERSRDGDGSARPQSFRVVVDPRAAKNLIPVDDVVCAMLRIAAEDPAPGAYFNLAHDVATPMTDLIAVIASLLQIENYEAVHTLSGQSLSVAESVLERVSGVFRPYMLKSDAHFETTAARHTGKRPPLPPVGRDALGALLQHFFEQHYDREFQPVPVGV